MTQAKTTTTLTLTLCFLAGLALGSSALGQQATEELPMWQPDYIFVFFAFDEDGLNDLADTAIAEAITKAAELPQDVEFSVTGYADSKGSSDYNMKLSLRRAEAVKSAMVEKGIAPERISVAARGESDQRVKTADGVANADNRRVEIIIQ